MLIVLVAVAACSDSMRAESDWVDLSPMSVARSEHPAVTLNGEIVVIGGLVESGLGRTGVTAAVEAYDPVSDSWRTLADLPLPRHHIMATVVSGRLFVIGGFSESGFDSVNTVWELSDGAWVERASLPEPVGAGAAVSVDGLVYVVGGVPDGGLFAYDPAADTWAERARPEVFREHVAAVVFDGEVWAIAGRAPGAMHSSTEIYDPATDTWRPGPTLSEARSGFGAVVVDGAIYVAGGEVFNPNAALASVERLDPGTGEWALVEPLPVGLHGNPLVEMGGILYLPGGSTRAGDVENAGEMFSLPLG